jgi:hypothetical protein
MMTKSKIRPVQSGSLSNSISAIESLPGQLSLFHEAAPLKMDPAEIEITARQRRELFYTGKDLPGAKEREQVILWDVP